MDIEGSRLGKPAAGGATLSPPVTAAPEHFTEAERARLAPHFTDLHGPGLALGNLPETVKGAPVARCSRCQGTLRRLFLDEFADSLPNTGGAAGDGDEGKRAADL